MITKEPFNRKQFYPRTFYIEQDNPRFITNACAGAARKNTNKIQGWATVKNKIGAHTPASRNVCIILFSALPDVLKRYAYNFRVADGVKRVFFQVMFFAFGTSILLITNRSSDFKTLTMLVHHPSARSSM